MFVGIKRFKLNKTDKISIEYENDEIYPKKIEKKIWGEIINSLYSMDRLVKLTLICMYYLSNILPTTCTIIEIY